MGSQAAGLDTASAGQESHARKVIGIGIGPDECLYTVCYRKRRTKILRIDIKEQHSQGFPFNIYLDLIY